MTKEELKQKWARQAQMKIISEFFRDKGEMNLFIKNVGENFIKYYKCFGGWRVEYYQ